MDNFLIPRRFVRIKALQNLYAYTIAQKAHKQEAIEQVKKDFIFDSFLDEADQKEKRAKEQSIAVALFSEAVEAPLDFAYAETNSPLSKPICDAQLLKETQSSTAAYSAIFEHRQASTPKLPLEIESQEGFNKIEQSVHRHLSHYLEALRQEQNLLQNGFNEAKESIYRGLLSTLQLLIEWHKLVADDLSNPTTLKNQLAQDPSLKEVYKNRSWMQAIDKNNISWAKDQGQIENWYRQFIQTAEIPKSHRLDPNNRVKLLEYILQNIIFQEGPVNDFFAMADLYWDEHKRIVKKILTHIFIMPPIQDFSNFILFWKSPKWSIEAAFYNHLLTTVIQNSARYETMVGEKTKKWDWDRILLTDKLILKLALAELLECKEIPFKVSINEYIEIAKWYGTPKSGIFINGVLEGVLKGLENKKTNHPTT